MSANYDTIGLNYANLRQPDPRIARVIHDALEPAQTVLNVGAGAGNYEPVGPQVTAVEPSIEMIAQRPPGPAHVVQGAAENLPFDDDEFDATMASLTVHHWTSKSKGMAEMRRVTRGRIVILTFDPAFRGFWLTDYFPELITLDEGQMPHLDAYQAWLGPVDITPVLIPQDCTDGFLSAYWRRPEAYLDSRVRAAISPFWMIGGVEEGLSRLKADLKSGAWARKHSALLDQDTCDCGYRLVVTR